jgi:hypothetical protein
MTVFRAGLGVLAAAGCAALTGEAQAVDIPEVGDETLTIDISNTSELRYHFDNRNNAPVDPANPRLEPSQLVDDNYGEWLNRLYLRSYYWKFSLGLRLDSAVYFNTLDRQGAQDLVSDELGYGNLDLENRFNRDLHTRYSSLVYPAKLWIGFKHKWIEATAGDFYEQLGRGLVFSVRKIDEVGIDTTVRGGKLKLRKKWDDFRLEGAVFGGQLNPLRIDFPTGRILHGGGSPMFFAFPEVEDFEYWDSTGVDEFVPGRERARPSYLEDNVLGGSLSMGPKQFQAGLNGAILFRQSNSEDLVRCLEGAATPEERGGCDADFPSFGEPDASRSHDQIRNFSGSLRVPTVEGIFDAYVEVAGQQQTKGRVSAINPDDSLQAVDDLWGYAVYGDLHFYAGPLTITLEGKHYRQFFPLAANINLSDPTFGALEYNTINYSLPPTTEANYVEQFGAPDVCISGGRGRVDAKIAEKLNLYGWVGRYVSFTEIDTTNNECDNADSNRTDTWDTAAGTEIDSKDGKSQYWAWVGARVADSPAPVPAIGSGDTTIFYREGYVRYDLSQHLAGPFSVSAVGNHRKRHMPGEAAEPWNEGENLLALNYNPHFSFVFGHEYQTREGIDPAHYFNGFIQYRSMADDDWVDQLTDTVRLFVGQRRAAVRCVAGICRKYPAFEGAKLELVSRF